MYVIIGYFSGFREAEVCYDGRRPFITNDYFEAISYKEELERQARFLDEDAVFHIKKLTNPED